MITPNQTMRAFTERYSADAIASISEMAADKTLYCKPIKAIDFKRGNESFREFLEGYVDYQCDKDHKDKPLQEILESTKKFVSNGLFAENTITYDKTPDFVGYYIEQMLDLDNLVNQSVGTLMDHGAPNEAIGLVSEMVSVYLESASSAVNSVIDNILWASGYNGKHRIHKATTPKVQESFVI